MIAFFRDLEVAQGCWDARAPQNRKNGERRILFLKNKAGELLKTKDEPKKQTENKAETKLGKLLETMKTHQKQSENKPENKASQVIENKRQPKNKPENKPKNRVSALSASKPSHVAIFI